MPMPKKKPRDRKVCRTVCLSETQMERIAQAMMLDPGAPGFSTWARGLLVLAADKAIKAGRPAFRVL